MINSKYALWLLFIIIPFFLFSQNDLPSILSMKERAHLQDRWLEIRLETVIPHLMKRKNADMWIIVSREYNEDPVFHSMAPATWLAARRRTILVFAKNKSTEVIDRLAIARYDVGKFFKGVWDPSLQPDQWKRLAGIIEEYDPKSIALNRSSEFALADGLTYSEFEALFSALPDRYRDRIISGECLAIGWLETRIPEEMDVYPIINQIAHRILAQGLSNKVIVPGHTTTEDVQWWYRERIKELKLDTWFHPYVSVQRFQEVDIGEEEDFSSPPDVEVIMQGDLVHVDFGITYLGLNTDTQRHAYVLRQGENDVPEGLKRALKIGNRLQDILTSNFVTGHTGNEILHRSREQAIAEGIVPSIYTHPLGFHGHGAGTTIGLWDQQEGVPVRGYYPLYPHTVHSIELNVTVEIPEWNNQKVRIMLEENAYFDGETVRYLDGRQTEYYIIR